MTVLQKVRAVEKLFGALDRDIQKLRRKTGIGCIENCVHCCTTPRITATEMEFYPLAYHLYKSGQADSMIARIEQIDNVTICPILNHLTVDGSRAGCSMYEHRGLICRLFAYNYETDKHGRRRLSACKPIRLAQPTQLDTANKILAEKVLGPRASGYYSRLQFIDLNRTRELYPIGQAIRQAIETVVTDFHYRGKKVV